MNPNLQNQQNFMDILQVLSLYLGYENLLENRQQSAHNDVQSANDQQAKFLLEAIDEQFNKQNAMLESILTELHNLNGFLYHILNQG